jgi:hypothetical protein
VNEAFPEYRSMQTAMGTLGQQGTYSAAVLAAMKTKIENLYIAGHAAHGAKANSLLTRAANEEFKYFGTQGALDPVGYPGGYGSVSAGTATGVSTEGSSYYQAKNSDGTVSIIDAATGKTVGVLNNQGAVIEGSNPMAGLSGLGQMDTKSLLLPLAAGAGVWWLTKKPMYGAIAAMAIYFLKK